MTRPAWLAAYVLGVGLLTAAPRLQGQEEKKESRGFRVPAPGMANRFNFGNNEFSIIDIDAVQKELALTDDQKAKVKELCAAFQKASRPDFPAGQNRLDREAMTNAVEEAGKKADRFTKEKKPELLALLSEEQKARLSQIVLQARGRAVYTEPEVQSTLELTAEQKEKLTAVSEEYAKKSRDQMAAARGNGAADRDAFNKSRKELIDNWTRAYQDVLTPAQKEKLERVVHFSRVSS